MASLGLSITIRSSSRLITMSNPSRDTVERLFQNYKDGLSCPCTRSTIPHHMILKRSPPRFHPVSVRRVLRTFSGVNNDAPSILQICSSVFIQKEWLDGYLTIEFENKSKQHDLHPLDLRVSGWNLFTAIQLFCEFYQSSVADAETVFLNEDFISNQVLSRK
jgi:hypothetical protein